MAVTQSNIWTLPDRGDGLLDMVSQLPLGTLTQDAEGPEYLPLYLPIEGTLTNASATVEYRVGAGAWSRGPDMYRIVPAYVSTDALFPVVDAFASTILDLTPGTTYNVRVTVTADEGGQTLTGTFTTRALPRARTGTPTVVNNETELNNAIAAATPGSVIQIAATTINLTGSLILNGSGTQADPIYLIGTTRDTSILQFDGTVISPQDTNHWVLEEFTIQGSGVDSQQAATSIGIEYNNNWLGQTGMCYRRLRLTGVDRGIVNRNGYSQNTMVYDCILEGNNAWIASNFVDNRTWNDDGLQMPGYGNCAWNNDITGFGDACAWEDGQPCYGNFYLRNKIRKACDDAIEAEYCYRNCGCVDNHTMNSATSVSVDEVYGGPYYHVRNRHVNGGARTIIKSGSPTTGLLFYNNTFVKTQGISGDPGGDRAWYWASPGGNSPRNWALLNNIIIWEAGPQDILRFDMASSVYTPWDCRHNGWGRDGGLISYAGDGNSGGVAAMNAIYTPRHDNDYEIAAQASVFEIPVVFGSDFLTEITTDYSLALSSGSTAIGKGVLIPGVTGHTDGGAIEFGATPPVYGNRFAG